MKCPDTQQWILLAMGAFDERQAAAMQAHAGDCAVCRREFEQARREHADLEDAHRLFDGGHDAGREQLMALLGSPKLGAGESPAPQLLQWAVSDGAAVAAEAQVSTASAHRLDRGEARDIDACDDTTEPTSPPVRASVRRSRLTESIRTLKIGDFLMNVSVRRPGRIAAILAPAACIIGAIALYSAWGEGRVFADAIARLRAADTISCRVRMTMDARFEAAPGAEQAGIDPARLKEKQEHTVVRSENLYVSATGGVRRDAFENDKPATTVYVSPGAEHTWIINHAESTVQEFGDDETAAMPEEMKDAMRDFVADRPMVELHLGGALDDPQQLIESLRTLAGDADRPLGSRTIEGVSAEGYEIDGKRVGFGPPLYAESNENKAEVWIDPRQDLPVLIVLRFVSRVDAVAGLPVNGTFAVTAEYSGFQIDPPLAENWFEPVIPAGYSQKRDEMTNIVESLNQEDFLEALRAFGEQAGRYPKSLQTMDAMYEVSYVVGSMQARRLAAKSKGEPAENLPDYHAFGQAVQGLAYYMVLEATGRRPAYFGTSVTPGDGTQVLLRWTLEDGRTRQVYGDLRVEDVGAPAGADDATGRGKNEGR